MVESGGMQLEMMCFQAKGCVAAVVDNEQIMGGLMPMHELPDFVPQVDFRTTAMVCSKRQRLRFIVESVLE